MNRFRRRRAFTLVEILLSVIILGLVMAGVVAGVVAMTPGAIAP